MSSAHISQYRSWNVLSCGHRAEQKRWNKSYNPILFANFQFQESNLSLEQKNMASGYKLK